MLHSKRVNRESKRVSQSPFLKFITHTRCKTWKLARLLLQQENTHLLCKDVENIITLASLLHHAHRAPSLFFYLFIWTSSENISVLILPRAACAALETSQTIMVSRTPCLIQYCWLFLYKPYQFKNTYQWFERLAHWYTSIYKSWSMDWINTNKKICCSYAIPTLSL